MSSQLRFASCLLLCAIFLAPQLPALPQKSAAQKPAPAVSDRERERRSLAVNLAHAINSAENSYKSKQGTYVNWDTLIGNGDFSERGTKWASESFPTVAHAMYGSGAEIVPGWKLRLLLSKDSNRYDLLLEDVTDPQCSYAVVSDERGLIRQGKSIDCPL
jgi:hypothetical protein